MCDSLAQQKSGTTQLVFVHYQRDEDILLTGVEFCKHLINFYFINVWLCLIHRIYLKCFR
jgi:hypothetical protein